MQCPESIDRAEGPAPLAGSGGDACFDVRGSARREHEHELVGCPERGEVLFESLPHRRRTERSVVGTSCDPEDGGLVVVVLRSHEGARTTLYGVGDEEDAVTVERVLAGPCVAWPEDSSFIREVLDRTGDKWTVLVMTTLGDRTLRYSDLLASIPGISQRMLTVTLKALERDGLVVRRAHAEMPPRVDYGVTDLGRSLQVAVMQLAQWAAENHAAVAANRALHERIGVGRARSVDADTHPAG